MKWLMWQLYRLWVGCEEKNCTYYYTRPNYEGMTVARWHEHVHYSLLENREAAATMPMLSPEYMTKYVKESPDLMDAIKRGVADVRAGRITSWEDARRELGLG